MNPLIAGVDIGGTNVVVGLVPEDGSTIHGVTTEPTHKSDNPTGTFDQVAHMFGQSVEQAAKVLGEGSFEVVGVGIGAPGPLDRKTGTVLVTPNLGWVDMPLERR